MLQAEFYEDRTANSSIFKQNVDIAAQLGIEACVLDAGWFGDAAERWWETVGDWDRENPLLTHGVKAAFDYAHAKGMQVGLWVEIERMGAASRLLRDHADWAMTKRGERIPNLDLSKPEVAQWAEDTLVGLIEKYELDCYRIDYNISTGEGGEAQRGGFTENVLWRYYDGLYAVFDHIRARFPGLLLENCSSGGGRTDLGILSRFHYTQVTDRWSPAPQLKIMNGMSLALPPELCMPLLGAISDGVSDIDFMLRIGLFGHMTVSGIFPTMAERHTEARKRWKHTIDLYKSFVRPMLSTCRMFHHTPIQRQTEPGEWVALECASPDGSRAYAAVFRLPGAVDAAYPLRLKGLDASRQYRVRSDNSGRTWEASGVALAEHGLSVAVPAALTSELLLFEAV